MFVGITGAKEKGYDLFCGQSPISYLCNATDIISFLYCLVDPWHCRGSFLFIFNLCIKHLDIRDPSVGYVDYSVAHLGDLAVVRYDHDRYAVPLVQLLEAGDYLP